MMCKQLIFCVKAATRLHKFVIEKGSTIDTIPARSNLNKNIDSKWYKEYNGK